MSFMKAIGTKKIKTERLLLRRLVRKDAEALHAQGCLVGDLYDAVRQVNEMLAEYKKPLCYHWVIEHEGRAIGRIRAWDIDPFNDHCQLGYDMSPSYRNRGLMTEAFSAVLEYLLYEVDCHRVYCSVRCDNLASARVLEKCGMTCEGVLRGHYKGRNGYDDVKIYGIIKR